MGGFEYRLQQVHAELGMKAIPFYIRSMVPLQKWISAPTKIEDSTVYSENECEGMCGV